MSKAVKWMWWNVLDCHKHNMHISKQINDKLVGVLETPDSRVHVANMRPTWGRQDPCGPHVGPMNLAIWGVTLLLTHRCYISFALTLIYRIRCFRSASLSSLHSLYGNFALLLCGILGHWLLAKSNIVSCVMCWSHLGCRILYLIHAQPWQSIVVAPIPSNIKRTCFTLSNRKVTHRYNYLDGVVLFISRLIVFNINQFYYFLSLWAFTRIYKQVQKFKATLQAFWCEIKEMLWLSLLEVVVVVVVLLVVVVVVLVVNFISNSQYTDAKILN